MNLKLKMMEWLGSTKEGNMDKEDYELTITDTIDQACAMLNINEFEALLERLEEYVSQYKGN